MQPIGPLAAWHALHSPSAVLEAIQSGVAIVRPLVVFEYEIPSATI